jgi:two-component system CheB/CheR fusion protein
MHALLIDDNPDDRALVKRELAHAFDKVEATDVFDADGLDKSLRRGDFDLVVTDFCLKWTDGLEVLKAVRRKYPLHPVIMYTGTGSEEVAVAAMQAGLDEYVIKSPVNIAQIRVAAASAMQKAAQRQALKEQEDRTRTILDIMVDGIVTIDERGLVQSFNPGAERIFGYAAAEVIGENIKILMPEPHANQHDRYIADYLRTGERKIIGMRREAEGRAKDGRVFPLELAVGQMRLSSGKRHFIGSLRDLSERTRLEEQLRRSQKMEALGQLTGGIAHDFNNLLTVILGNLELVGGKAGADAELRRAVEIAMSAADRAAALTRRLLGFSRRQVLQPQSLDLANVVNDMSEMLARTLGENVRVETVCPADLWHVMADKHEIENAVLNLAINGRDAMPRGGTITIETRNVRIDADYARENPDAVAGDHVMISVVDTGTGMPPAVLARAFEPFFTTKEVGKGTGLGLSMVYGFARQSSGHVKIESEIGKGTTVKLYLPRCELDRSRAVTDAVNTVSKRGGETILVVEDDELVRGTVIAQLERLGYRVIAAKDGPSALIILNGGTPIDLLFTDVVMPGGISGRELACEAVRLRPQLKVVFTSGYEQMRSNSKEPMVERADFLPKPFKQQELACKMREALGAAADAAA